MKQMGFDPFVSFDMFGNICNRTVTNRRNNNGIYLQKSPTNTNIITQAENKVKVEQTETIIACGKLDKSDIQRLIKNLHSPR